MYHGQVVGFKSLTNIYFKYEQKTSENFILMTFYLQGT